jgi:hypothetical protein
MDGVLVGAAGWFTLATESSLCELAALHTSKKAILVCYQKWKMITGGFSGQFSKNSRTGETTPL